MRGPRAQVVRFQMLKVWNQVPSVVFVDPPQHVCCRLDWSLRQEGLNFSCLVIGLPTEQGVLVKALPTPSATGVRRAQTGADHVTEARLLHQTNRAGLADAANGQDNVEARTCLLYTSPSPRDATLSRMPSSA